LIFHFSKSFIFTRFFLYVSNFTFLLWRNTESRREKNRTLNNFEAASARGRIVYIWGQGGVGGAS